MTQRKKLIEVALPLEAINEASAREKSIRHGHPSTLHLWWARRPLAAARAVIFTSLVDDPGHHPEDHDEPVNAPAAFIEACKTLPKGKNATGVDEKGRSNDTPRMRLFDFIEHLVTWEATTDEEILTTARELIRLSTDGNPPPLLDPFAGGGSIPLEAQRLGLEAHASDLNPVAVMINKALIEIPPKFANQPPVNPCDRAKVGGTSHWKGASGLAADVRYYGEWMREKAWERIGHLYPECNGETVIAWLWARTVKCPNPACGSIIPLTSTFSLSTKTGKKAWVEPVIDQKLKSVKFILKKGKGKPPDPTKVGRGSQFRCLVCGEIASEDHIKSEGKAGRMHAQLIGIVTEGAGGRNYFAPNSLQEKIAGQATPDWKPDFEMSTHPQYMAPPRYGMTMFSDLFMPRQLLALETFSNLVEEVIQQAYEDALNTGFLADSIHLEAGGAGPLAYSEAIGAYLGLTVGRQVNRLSTLCFWDAGSEKVQQVFSRQALTMNWNYVEANPFSSSTGNFLGQLVFPIKMLGTTVTTQPGFAKQLDATERKYLNSMMVSTDPPYYDNVPYADLSDFFYVWLRLSLRQIYPTIFGTMLVPKNAELVADHQRHGGRDDANDFFEAGMKRVFEKLCDSTNSNYPLTVYYAFRQAESENTEGTASTGWETMLEGLIRSGYTIQATWPMRTEQVTNIKKYRNALASSIVLVCRPRPENASITSRREFVNTLRQELPTALREMQSGNIAPVDLAQASIGPGMGIYSRYSKVLEANGDRLSVRAALQLINQVLDEYLAEVEGELDGDSRFAVSWFEQFGFNSGEFGVADVLARAKNTSVEGLVQAGVIESGMGKVRLLTWEELDPGWDPSADKRPTVWEATHHLIERINIHGEEGAALLLSKMSPELAANGRQLAYRLYAICERKGWADHARDYNALVISWSSSQERAAEVKQTYQQKRLI